MLRDLQLVPYLKVRAGSLLEMADTILPTAKTSTFSRLTWSVPKNNGHWPPIDTLAINAIGTNFTVIYEVTDSTQNPPRKIIDVDDAVNASIGSPYTLLSHLYGTVQKASVPGMVKVKVYLATARLPDSICAE